MSNSDQQVHMSLNLRQLLSEKLGIAANRRADGWVGPPISTQANHNAHFGFQSEEGNQKLLRAISPCLRCLGRCPYRRAAHMGYQSADRSSVQH